MSSLKFTSPNDKAAVMPKSLEESFVSRSPPRSGASSVKEPIARQSPHGNAKPGTTYAYQDRLQKLPIPDLEETCRKYLNAVRPLQTPREYADTEAAVGEFLEGDGPELQERLKNYANSKSSYIEQFCKLSLVAFTLLSIF